MKSNYISVSLTLFCIFLIFTKTMGAVSENGVKQQEENLKRVLQGSAPPSCVGKCGGCTPCQRVSAEVGPDEYVWKCACMSMRSRLFRPYKFPECNGKCGGCTPCKRVLEEVAPGRYVFKCVCKP